MVATSALTQNDVAPVKVGYRETLALLSGAQKSGNGAPAYSRFVNRPAGRFLAAGAYQLGMTPNAVTVISGLFSFAGLLLLVVMPPSLLTGILVCIALLLGYALDSADGQLARLRGGGSVAGEWLDHMVDATKISTMHLSVLIAFYRFFDLSHVWLLVPIGYSVVAAVAFFGFILNEQLYRNFTLKTGVAIQRGGASVGRSLLVIPADYGLLCLAFALWGATHLFAGVYLAMLVANAAFLVLRMGSWFRSMKTLSTVPVKVAQ
jgi:phosphatidylglycerophosphate synthase